MQAGQVSTLRRYPVKSLLGEDVPSADLTSAGMAGDRAFAFIDVETGKVASAKRPKLWRDMLAFQAATGADGTVGVRFPDGRWLSITEGELDAAMSRALGRAVRLAERATAGLALDRAVPEDVLAVGEDGQAASIELVLAQGSPEGGFFDFAPYHVMTRASLAAIDAACPHDAIVADRYRPNIVLDMDVPAFAENDWVGAELAVGADVMLKVIAPTPRCAVPMLAHGAYARAPGAVSAVAARNSIPLELLGPGNVPCLGAYAVLTKPGRVSMDDPVRVVTMPS
ncbi:MOSC domain-containing protein [Chelatococcus reniformis]|uniref:Molybdenum cofactor biosysynthesis protein n=1 Tax=Chelatococcus reniformis TaxID=1494448 RepID=A0A916U757_9HYPH|nr:MOSC N-terminal beta barrel domain-containing protein [Chelatococcus reniformis]GGC61594.1 molybdenum cofactor biosysynthesis protein [Chelatococcus reniformis]